MKPSGVPWIGDIPVEWEIRRLKSVARIARGGSPRPIEDYLSDVGYNWIKISDATRCGKYITSTVQKIVPAGLSKTRLVHKGALLLTNSMSFGTPYIMGIDGCIHDGWVAIADLQDVEKEFLYYFLSSMACKGQFDAMVAGGVVQNLNVEKIGGSLLPLPPLPEQRAIAAFLDEKCAAIDAIVDEAKAGLAEYADWKRSIIFHAVTKGIPEDASQPGGRPSPAAAARGDATGPGRAAVPGRRTAREDAIGFGRAAVPGRRAAREDARPPMKDSGEKWIGQIPPHWSVLPLKTHADMLTPMRDRPEHLDGPIPWIRIEDFDGKYISRSKDGLGVSETTVREMNLKIYPVGTVLCTSSCDLGKCAIVATPLVSNQRFIGIIPKPGLLADFLHYLMLSNAERLNMLSTGTIQANLSRVEFERLRVQIPPLPEQRAIAAWLDEKCAAIDALVEEKKKLIEDLGAYKKSLIYETVTGKRRIKQ